MWPGFYSAMQRVEAGPYIILDLTNKVIRSDTLYGLLEQLSKKGLKNEQISEEIKFQIVVTSYGSSKRTYRLSHIDFERSPSSTFEIENGKRQISFGEYYREKYGVTIKDSN